MSALRFKPALSLATGFKGQCDECYTKRASPISGQSNTAYKNEYRRDFHVHLLLSYVEKTSVTLADSSMSMMLFTGAHSGLVSLHFENG